MAPCLFEQEETKLRGISYCKISLGGFTLLTTGNSANIYRNLSNKPGGRGKRLICPAIVEGGELGAYWSGGRGGGAYINNWRGNP